MTERRRILFPLTVLTILILLGSANGSGQVSGITGTSEIKLALKRLQVLGGALYVAAHPDDENTSVLAALAKGRLVRTAYLAMTRGEGGQNLIGPEQGEVLGVIRTQELLAARRIDGAEQFFTRAMDFGYSKTSEETIRIWGREKIVGDIVWVIRTFRPDVIITRFADTLGGHGNHTASAILAREAFIAAGDPGRFPEQLRFVKPWKPRRIVFNVFRFRGMGMEPTEKSVALDVGEYSPILGSSFTELAGRSRSMHKSQGFGAAENRGSSLQHFEPTEGEQAQRDLFDGVDLSWSRIPGGEAVGRLLSHVEKTFDPENPAALVPELLRISRLMDSLPADPWVNVKRRELHQVILGCYGLWLDAIANVPYAPPSGEVEVKFSALNRSRSPVILEKIGRPIRGDTIIGQKLQFNATFETSATFRLPVSAKSSHPYWLDRQPDQGSYVVEDQRLVGQPENPPALTARFHLQIDGERMIVETPVRYRWVDPVDGELSRMFSVVPPVAVNLSDRLFVFADRAAKDVRVILKGSGHRTTGTVRLEVPSGWKVTPTARPFEVSANGEEVPVTFTVSPGESAVDGEFSAVVESGGRRHSLGRVEIRYPHIPVQTLFPPASGRLVRLEIKAPQQRVGYITGSGDGIPDALRQLGYSVSMLSDEDLEFSDLSQYDVIVAGVRAYNTRPKLRAHQRRLMDYVNDGGRYVVQYVTQQRFESENLGPFPFSISRARVTVEDAPVRFNDPDHPLLLSPNRITERDFEGWIQERGLYFADSWDPRYETILASSDPGEPPQRGGLIMTKYGKGTYIYTGYSFFRQIPAGVPGAYRLFVNLLHNPRPK